MIDVLVTLLVLLLFPFVVFFSVKLGTYAFYRGRALFEEENENGTKG